MDAQAPKTKLEQDWNDTIMAHNRRWQANRSTHRLYVREGSELVLWQAVSGRAEVARVYRVDSIALTAAAGLLVWISRLGSGSQVLLNYTPNELPGTSVFAWVPSFADVRYTPAEYRDLKSPRRLSVPLCIKTLTNPMKDLKEGAHYLTERREFEKTWGLNA